MRIQKTLILFLFLQLNAVLALAQKDNSGKSTYTRSRFNSKIACPGENKYVYHSLGIKLGDPFALTYKFYIGHFSMAADIGKASSGLYSGYYKNKFSEYVSNDTLTNGSSISYLTSRIKSDWVGEIKFLYSLDVKAISPGLLFYIGLGLQAKSTQIEYTYQYANVDVGKFDRARQTLGQTSIAGIEYNYANLPISAFMEVELFTDVLLDPGLIRFQGGVGLRYNFR